MINSPPKDKKEVFLMRRQGKEYNKRRFGTRMGWYQENNDGIEHYWDGARLGHL